MLRRSLSLTPAFFSLALLETVAMTLPVRAYAAAGTGQVTTLGDAVQRFGVNVGPSFGKALVGGAFLYGLFLVGMGLYRMIETYGHRGEGTAMRDALTRILCGCLLIGLPELMGVGVSSLFLSNSQGYRSNMAGTPVGAVTSCVGGSAGSVPMACMAQNFMVNVVPVGLEVLFGLSYLGGAIYIARVCAGLAKSNAGRGEAPRGWKTELAVGVSLLYVPGLISLTSNTIGLTSSAITTSGFIGLNGSEPPSILAYSAPISATNAMLTKYSNTIGYILAIFVLFGAISFVRGLLILRRNSMTGTNTTTMGAGTHMIAGVLMTNSKATVCFVLNSTYGYGFGFC